MSVIARPEGIRPSTRYLPEIESLRGVAVLLVFAFHLDLTVMQRFFTPAGEETSPLLAFVRAGHTGVTLFFVISGFLLARPFLIAAAGGSSLDRINYLTRRALRILPLYYAVVLIAAAHNATQISDLARAIPYMLFLNGFDLWTVPLPPYSAVWWTLAIEVQFYLAVPLAAALFVSPRGRRIGVILFLLYITAYAAFVSGVVRLGTLHRQVLMAHSLFGEGPLFLFGAAAAWIEANSGPRIRANLDGLRWIRNGGADCLLLGALGALGWLLARTISHGPTFDAPPFFAWRLGEGMLWASILILTLLAPLRLRLLFSNHLLRWLGVISYSVYIVHVPVLAFLFALLRRYGAGPVAGWSSYSSAVAASGTALCIAVALITYHAVERPFLAYKARIDN